MCLNANSPLVPRELPVLADSTNITTAAGLIELTS